MKKGVFGNLRFELLFLAILALCTLPLASGFDGPPITEGDETALPTGTEIPLDAPFTDNANVPGYWIGFALNSDNALEKHYAPNVLADHPEIPPSSDSYGAREQPWVLNIKEPAPSKTLYDYFNFNPQNYELQYVVFALDMLPFQLEDVDTILTSHGYPVDDLGYEGGEDGGSCITCASLDSIDQCINGAGDFLPAPASCINIQILNRKSCTEMADWSQSFCEGTTGVGWNKGKEDPAPTGKPGYGGCQQEPDTVATGRDYGRDWYAERISEDAINILSDQFLGGGIDKARIGRCCGNDIEDLGALAIDKESAGSYRNAYLCYNDSKLNANGDFNWSWARESGKQYNIVTIEKEGLKFDAISNTNNWFICNTGDEALDRQYAPAHADDMGIWDTGVLVSEYSGLPKPIGDESAGTTLLGGEEGDWTGDGTSATDLPTVENDDSADEIVDEETFSSEQYDVDGASAVTSCDQDGDGYEGPWTSDSSSPWYDETGNCDDPQPPFDCDDTMGDNPRAEDGSIIPLARMRHPGRIDYCVDGEDRDLDCEPATPCVPEPTGDTDSGDMLTNPDAKFFNPRFICHNVDNAGEFAECCGWDLGYCLNSAKGRREGAAIHTLREFDHYNTVLESASSKLNKTNFVLRYGIDVPTSSSISDAAYYRLSLRTDNNDLKIKDWKHYKNLEFYIWFTANYEVELWIGKFTGDAETAREDPRYYTFPFKARITDYVVNEPGLRKWLHVVIPIEDILAVDFKPEMIVFASNAKKLKDLGTIVTWADGGPFSNVVGIDKIFLLPKQEDMPSGADNLYCSGTWPPVWLKDLDSTEVPEGATGDQPEGRNACEAIPSYGWTGSMCCGDDTGEDTLPGTIGPATFKEFYADDAAGCWGGNVLADNERVMLIKYNMFSSSYSGEVTRSCTNRTCAYDLPPIPGVFVTNEHADVYDLAFVDGGYTPIGAAAVSPTADSYLKAENVPLQVLYLAGEYWACNAADFLSGLEDTVNGGPLIIPENFLTSEGESCTIKGDYFCDHKDGENSGWNSHALARYPASNLTMIDGTEIELGSGTNVNATMRIWAKRDYNMIDNGGFENV